MSKLQAALDWARRGFRVFPLTQGGKLPLADLGWTLHATTDEAVIRMWWSNDMPGGDYNVGFLTTDWIVPDVDVKDGKTGLDTMARLGLEFDTLTMRTPTGGYHLVYNGLAHPVGQTPLGLGIDVRSHHGYVVAPGSTIDFLDDKPVEKWVPEALGRRLSEGGKIERRAYEVEIDLPVAEFPAHLRHLLKVPRRRADVVPADVELDAPETVELVAHWLLHDARPAVEGENGDDATYRVCCRIRDYGISEAQALDLFLDEFNPRCLPPWSPDEARLKIENAYRYATGDAGALSPAAAFGHVEHVPLPEPSAAALLGAVPADHGDLATYGNMLAEADIAQRPWVLTGMLSLGVVTTLVAPGGAGKSLLSLLVAAHLAVGRDFLGCRCVRPGKSVIYNAEDDREEMSRRLNAIIAVYGLDAAQVVPRIALVGSDDTTLTVTRETPPVPNEADIARIARACSDPECVLFSVDPLVEVHTGRENDPGDMRNVMGVFRGIARLQKVAMLIVQHTGKTVADASDQMSGRGSSAIPAAARVVLNLTVAKESDCVAIGAPTADHRSYVRLDGAKANALAAKDRAEARWMRWESHRLSNGDGVGVLVEHDAATASRGLATKIAAALAARLLEDGQAGTTLDEACALAAAHGFRVSKPEMQRMFAEPVSWNGTHHVVYRTENEGTRRTARLVMR